MPPRLEERPIRIVVRDEELRRSRLTVFLRLLLALPHLVWLSLWGIAASFAAIALWLGVVIEGKAPESLHDFVARYLRYATHVATFVFLAASPFPGFGGAPGYPVDVEIDPPARQSRWTGFFRLVLALPAALLASALGAGLAWTALAGPYVIAAVFLTGGGVAGAAALLTWFAALVRGRAPRGLRDLTAYALGYSAESAGYGLLLTGRYPSTDPALAEPYAPLPEHAVRISVTDELARPRLVVLFRLLLAFPHFFWLALWGLAVFFTVIAAWLAALAVGRVPPALHRFLAAYVRYATHVFAFTALVGRRFPGFTGRVGSYQIDVELPGPVPQRRIGVLGRLLLAIPALLVANALGTALWVAAFLAWWYAIVRGRMPEGLRNLGASCLRYNAQTYAYLLLVTPEYPYAGPVLPRPARREPLPSFVPGDAF
ncbi:MAG: DUF4389 domain-containing protein [Gaiellaceae bacterium]